MTWARRARRRLASRKARQEGYAAFLVAVLFASGLLFALAALSVDVGRWYDEGNKVQKAADAAALAGVPYLPYDFTNAKAKALEVAKRNGYDDADPNIVVTVALGDLTSQLKVTISSTIRNSFGGALGINHQTMTRTATADYKGPAPMGSPCNAFGNEPTSGSGASLPSGTAQGSGRFANCTAPPQFWASVEGPQTDKVQGDRYQTKSCTTGVDGCAGTTNSEYDDFGYTFVVKVQPSLVGKNVTLQLYDPEFAYTAQDCSALPATGSWSTSTTTATNPYSIDSDSRNRYASNGTSGGQNSAEYCTGDNYPGTNVNATHPAMTTTFLLRQQIDTQDPHNAPVQNNTGGVPCLKQYYSYAPAYNNNTGDRTWDPNITKSSATGTYNGDLMQVFHNWSDFCTFIPPRAGDYYLQVRTNVAPVTGSGNTIVKSGDVTTASALTGNSTAGEGANAFAIRAVTPTGLEQQVAVSGYDHMPIFMNASSATAQFNLIRVLPGAAGQYISFSFFDAGDAASDGDITVLPPGDATGTITSTPFPGSCKANGGYAGAGATLTNCDAHIQNTTNNGKSETMIIPIPSDYACNYASLGGCWYRVQVAFHSSSGPVLVHDQTTWDATIIGDPVRLIK